MFDLDGCVWQGSALEPGARGALTALHASGRALGFLSNNSRASGEDLRRRLLEHGIDIAQHVLTPLDIIGDFITERFGRSRALVMGASEFVEAVRRGGHQILEFDAYRKTTVVVVGNDFDVSYTRITAAARAVAGGAPLVTPNLDHLHRWGRGAGWPPPRPSPPTSARGGPAPNPAPTPHSGPRQTPRRASRPS